MEKYPFSQAIFKNSIIRTFSQDVDPEELKWHRDYEDRMIESIDKTDWLFQFDNELPISLNQTIFIQAGIYHRIIKGTGNLLIQIIKC